MSEHLTLDHNKKKEPSSATVMEPKKINMKKVQSNDSFQRINYLYQISKQVSANNTLSSYYGNLIVNIAKKNVLKIHPDIKRQFCKKCRCVLINGVSATKNIRKRDRSKFIEWTCNTCGTKRSLPLHKNKDNRVWTELDEAVVEVITL